MAAATISIEQDQFCCSVCLEVLRDPVTIPCGHSYCLDCIEDFWNRSQQRGQYTCPQCRQVFNPKPLLSRNTVLGEVVEKFLQSGSQSRHPAKVVKCSVCRTAAAVKSCLLCVMSFCPAHLRAHDANSQGKRAHRLIPAMEDLEGHLCLHHHRLLTLYCRTDQNCVCSHCVKGRHKNHDAVSVEEQRAAQQKKLQEASLKSEQKLKDTEKELRYVVRYIKHSAEAAAEESERIFSRLIRSIEKQSGEVKELIRLQEKAAVGKVEELLEKIQREMAVLKRAEGELLKLSGNEDHVRFLQDCKALHFPASAIEMPNTDALPYLMYKSMREAMTDLRLGLGEMLDRELSRISDKVISLKKTSNQSGIEKNKAPDQSYNLDPKTRADFLQYYSDITLDPNTANPYLSFSDGRREVTTRFEAQPYPDHPARFTSWAQVLCCAGMAGRCYWEVEWSGTGGVSIGICYKNMSRCGGGSDSKLGHNSKSWSLDCSYTSCLFQHNKESVAVTTPCSSRVGVYLDFRAGTLSFYNVSSATVLLHKVQTTFSQPVYPGFWVGLGSSLKLCCL
ncbi:E3 ubiquitin/ISG15 ligase TRIM25 [Takifugu rubripes]|uniref:E3 ubiquitin/ISG15 ligase TRIM25-like n=1 Tax=Takifugu rubripes TaxID=31033 RepID=H2UBU1_TAKRU|nr:E3 ubiquitin/ISG15 ligase TRIM25-like [Takifugu rubripes]|eukprot:XP_011614598.1 PREDICTED: E3 ubiquitin/ISG15 ligase TRIM25-like [Takifugu rubripes]